LAFAARRGRVASAKADSNIEAAIADNITAITPIGLVAGAATRTEKGKLQIASGQYNEMIDQKIVQIKTTCGIQ